MSNPNKSKKYIFKGGVRIGIGTSTWPNGILEIHQDSLILHDKCLKRELKFLKTEINRIEVKKIVPLVGYGIRIFSNNFKQNDAYYFWYVGLHFSKFIDVLKNYDYI